MILGTAGYMSPEQARGRHVDRRTDIWAFGCVLYEMLTAQRIFMGETATDVLGAIVHRDPDWDLLPAETPRRIRALLHRSRIGVFRQSATLECRSRSTSRIRKRPRPSSTPARHRKPRGCAGRHGRRRRFSALD